MTYNPKSRIIDNNVINIKDFGAKGDGGTDDTAAIQNAFNVFSNQLKSGKIIIPVGSYIIASSIVYKGWISHGLNIEGVVSTQGGNDGSLFKWTGPSGQYAVLEIAGGCDIIIRDLIVDTNNKAQYGIYMHNDSVRTQQVNHVLMENVIINGNKGSGCACLSIGVGFDSVTSTLACDDIELVSCKFLSGAKGVVTGGGNTKNFFVDRSAFWFNDYGFDFSLGGAVAGVCAIKNCNFLANKTTDVRMGVDLLTMETCQSEGSAAMLVNYGTTSNPANARIVGCNFDSGAITDPDGVIIKFQGSLYLESNLLYNNNPGGTGLPGVRMDYSSVCPTALISQLNHFSHASGNYTNSLGSPVFTAGNGTNLLNLVAASGRIKTFGDYGGIPGAITYLTPVTPR